MDLQLQYWLSLESSRYTNFVSSDDCVLSGCEYYDQYDEYDQDIVLQIATVIPVNFICRIYH